MAAAILHGLAAVLIGAVNAVIAGLAVALVALLAVLPDMPDPPVLPDAFETAAGWVAWFWPVSTTLDVLTFVLAMWLLWQLVVIGLRWAKATSG